MGVLSNNYAQIIPGALISASYVSDIYNVLLGSAVESISLSGSLSVNGSITVTSGIIYGSLSGNASTSTSASYAVNCTTASFAKTASFLTATNILTITPVHPLPTNMLTGSFAVSASIPPKPYFWDGTDWNALY
jgi:hypothetical protein